MRPSRPTLLSILVATGCVLAVSAQEPTAPAASALVAGFGRLPGPAQAAVVERIDRRLRASDDAVVQRILAAAGTIDATSSASPATFHDPAVFAPVAPRRTLVQAGAPLHRAALQQFPPPQWLSDLEPEVVYDWSTGQVARASAAIQPAARFANFAAGYPPGSDAAVAAILSLLDRDGEQRLLAGWFEHLYADRDGNVFAGIRLYDAWYSGRTVEVPDVDAIAFARQVLQTQSFVSPIPDGRRRDRLYGQIKEAFARHRVYRTLLQAAAAAFVSAAPDFDPTYQPLLPRLLLSWTDCDFDLGRFADRLQSDDRAALIAALDQRLDDEAAIVRRDAAQAQLVAMAAGIRRICAEELAAAAGR